MKRFPTGWICCAPPALTALLVTAMVLPRGLDAQDCTLRYRFGGAGQEQSLDLTRGETRWIDQTEMAWVRNLKPREASVEVTQPTGGTKWVRLDQNQVDPPVAGYVGNVALKQVRCEHRYPSPVHMFDAGAGGASEFARASAVKDEFELGEVELTDLLDPRFEYPGGPVLAHVLDELFGYGAEQVASRYRAMGHDAGTAWSGMTGWFDSPMVQVLQSAGYTVADIATGIAGLPSHGVGGAAARLMAEGIDAVEIAEALNTHPASAGMSPVEFLDALAPGNAWRTSLPHTRYVRGVATARGVDPVGAMQWLVTPAAQQQQYDEAAVVLRWGFDNTIYLATGHLAAATQGQHHQRVLRAIESAYGADEAEVVHAANAAGVTAPVAYQLLEARPVPERIGALRSGEYDASELAGIPALHADVNQDHPDRTVWSLFAEAGYGAEEVARAMCLPTMGSLTPAARARHLLVQYSPTKAGRALSDGCGLGTVDVTRAFRESVVPLSASPSAIPTYMTDARRRETARMLRDAFGMDLGRTAGTMARAGFDARDTGKGISDGVRDEGACWRVGPEAVDALSSAGFSDGQVERGLTYGFAGACFQTGGHTPWVVGWLALADWPQKRVQSALAENNIQIDEPTLIGLMKDALRGAGRGRLDR